MINLDKAKIGEINVYDVKTKLHYVKTYPKWKEKICSIVGVSYLNNFYVELSFSVDKESDVEIGDFVIFNNYLHSRLDYVIEKDSEKVFTCFFFTETPIKSFFYSFTHLSVIGRISGEKSKQ
jgi:hypothetical protein